MISTRCATRLAQRAVPSFVLALSLASGVVLSQREAGGQDKPPAPPASPDNKPEEPKIAFTAERMSVKAFLQVLSEKGGISILDDAGVDGEITATANKKLTVTEALELLSAWLEPKQRVAVRQGNIVRIMTLDDFRKKGNIPVKIGAEPKDVPDNEQIVTQVIPLRRIRAEDVNRNLKGLLTAEGQLYVEPTSNALIITDTQHAIRRVLLVLDPLDRSPSLELRVKVFHLLNANADEVANMIRDIFPRRGAQGQQGGPQGGGGRGGGGQGGLAQLGRMFFGGGQPGGQPGATGGAEIQEVQVSIDKRSNSVVVAATQAQLELLEPLVAEIDKTPIAVVTDLKAFRLVNAAPSDLAAILQDIFQPAPATGGANQQNQVPPWARQFVGQQQGATGESSHYVPDPKFTVDARTNSLIVSAVPSQMKIIEGLVKDLDQDSSFRQTVLVVPLKNADAANVAKVMADLLNAAGTNAQRIQPGQQGVRGSLTTPLSELTGDVKITADADSNALVVTTSPKNFPRIRQIITELDRTRREVLLETLIAEITLDSKGELGVQWTTKWIEGIDMHKGGTSQASAGLGIDALVPKGFQYTSTSDKVTMLIRALQTDGRLNVLSSPKILTLENQAAEISVGRDVPYVTNSRITQNGDTVNTVQYRTVGVILKVTPHINEAGDVRMVVHPEVSEQAPQSEGVQITTGVVSPVFEKNFADTTIVVRDGETAVIGGMIRDELTETVQKMPILGDIPLIGIIFRAKTSEKKKVEIVVFMTPHVVDTPDQLAKRSRQTAAKYVLVAPELLKDELDRWTRGLDDNSAVKHYNRGTVYMENGHYPEAIEELEEARSLAPNDAATRFNLGLAYARKGDLEQAESELRVVTGLDPRDAEVHYNLGCVFWRRKDYANAAREFRATVKMEPTHDDARRWLARAEAAAKADLPEGNGENK